MKVPKNWNKLPLENFVHFLEYKEEEPENLQERIELIKKKSCAVLGCTWEEVNHLTSDEQNKLTKLMATPLPKRLMLSFKHKGKRYRFYLTGKERGNRLAILDKVKEIDTEAFNGGKYVAFKNVQRRGTIKYLHHLLFLCCEPRTFGFKRRFPFIGWKPKKLNASQIEKRIEDFKTLPLEVAYPMFTFFLRVCEKLKDPLLDYLNNEIQIQIQDLEQIRTDLESDMDG